MHFFSAHVSPALSVRRLSRCFQAPWCLVSLDCLPAQVPQWPADMLGCEYIQEAGILLKLCAPFPLGGFSSHVPARVPTYNRLRLPCLCFIACWKPCEVLPRDFFSWLHPVSMFSRRPPSPPPRPELPPCVYSRLTFFVFAIFTTSFCITHKICIHPFLSCGASPSFLDRYSNQSHLLPPSPRPQVVMARAQVLLHRFYYRKSLRRCPIRVCPPSSRSLRFECVQVPDPGSRIFAYQRGGWAVAAMWLLSSLLQQRILLDYYL